MKKKGEPKIEIRTCRMDDLEEVYAIERRNFLSPWPKSWFESLLLRRSVDLLVATESQNVVGYAVGVLEGSYGFWDLRRKRWGHLLDIVVKRKRRRRGIGTSLLQDLIKRLKKRGAESVRLEVRVQNIEARKFYQTLGFREDGLVKCYYPNCGDALIMVKRLD